MSNPVKLRCLDDFSQNMFVVSVNTRASINASTGALVLHNGGLSINSTENALNSFVGGALTVGGGAAFAKDLKVEGGMTIANINLTGDLFQNGAPYASSQWVSSTNGSISYTSGSVETTNLNITNFTVANFNGINFTAGNLVVDTLNLGMSNIFSGSFNATNNLQVPTNVEGFVLGSNITAFQCNLIVSIVATSNLYENFNLSGNKSSTGWNLYVSSIGDTTGINFFITTNGELQYISSNINGFVSSTFRYVVTQINETGRYTEFQPSSSGSYIFNTIQISGTQQASSGVETGSFLVDGGATVSKNLVVNGSLISNNNSNTLGSLITTGGNIGIGTNSPQFKLDVNGNVKIRTHYSNSTSGGLTLDSSDGLSGYNLKVYSFTPAGNQVSYNFQVNNINSSIDTITLAHNGNVGIRTTSPNYSLDVNGTFDASNSNGVLLFNSAGNVGIGSTSPNAKIHIQGPVNSMNGPHTWITNTGNSFPLFQQLNWSDVNIALNFNMYWDGSAQRSSSTSSSFQIVKVTEQLRFNLANGSAGSSIITSTAMCIGSTGNIGIGTIAPTSSLHVEGRIQCAAGDGDKIQLTNITNGSKISHLFGWGLGLYAGRSNVNEGFISFHAGSHTERMRITNDGNVGIGTSSPNSRLHISSNTSTNLIISGVTTNTSGGVGILFQNDDATALQNFPRYKTQILAVGDGFWGQSNLHFLLNNVNNTQSATLVDTRMVIRNNGNVGIGTNSPGTTLDVNGIIRASSGILISSTNVLEFGHGISKEASAGKIGYNTFGAGLHIVGAGTGTTNRLVRIFDNLTLDGTIGIGTSAPNGKMEITGTGNGWGLAISYSSSNMGGSYYSLPLTFMNSNGVSTVNYSQNYTEYTGRIPSVYNSNGYAGTAYLAFSDRRIKENIEEINDANALELLRQIQPSTYNYIDKLNRSTKKVYGFIAQQVKEVLPECIEFIKEYLPTIYKKGTITNTTGQLILKLQEPSTFPFSPLIDTTNTSGNTVYCYTSSGQPASDNLGNQHFQLKVYDKENKEFIVKIQEIIDETTFILNSSESKYDENETEYFVYGQLANDYHSLDKNYVFTVATAALQEVDRQLQSEKQVHLNTTAELQETKERLNLLETFLKSKFPGEI